MAAAILSPLVKAILNKIVSFSGDLVAEEIKGFKLVKKDLKDIHKDLESINSVLHDAESKQYSNAALKIWLRDLKNVAYDIDDLFDEVFTYALQKSVNKGHFFTQLKYYVFLKPPIARFQLSHKIKELRLELNRIAVKKSTFILDDHLVEAPNVRDIFDACGYVNKQSIVGRDDDEKKIIDIVVGLGDESGLSVLPIIGIGEIGKTALAKLVYNDIDQFDIKLWVCVSDKFDIQKILQDVLKAATSENSLIYSLGKLVERVQDVLNGKKFFLVLDDFWEDDIRLWNELTGIFNVGGRGRVILITTRMEKVASITKTVDPYILDKLPDSFCWRVFKNLAFADGEEEMNPTLKKIGMSIVNKCSGNPLVVQCLGSLLRSERQEKEWLRIKNMDNLIQLDGRYETVKQLLKLSYDKLPSHLKPLFAHLSLYPKDNVYALYYHFYTYSALGLLQLNDGSYFNNNNVFNELLSRSMLQDVNWGLTNLILNFKIHDLLHDVARDVLNEELTVVTKLEPSVPDSSRYIAWGLNSFSNQEFPKQFKSSKARVFIFQYQMRSVSQSFLNGIISSMPRLRVLDLGCSQFEGLPSSIGSLKHLRVLNLSSNPLIKSLPNTLCKLLNLECLLLEGCKQLTKLPLQIYKLVNLRFISITTCQRSLAKTKLNRLPVLQHIWLVSCEELVSLWDGEDIRFMTSLCSLGIFDCPKLTNLPNNIKLLVGLEDLQIENCELLDLEGGDALSGLLNLRSLTITGVPRLTCLPNGLRSATSSLKYLWIDDCEALAELPEWLASCVSLQQLLIHNCQNLLSLPDEIFCLNFLQNLEIENCPHISERFTEGDVALFRSIPEIWLDGQRIAHNQQ